MSDRQRVTLEISRDLAERWRQAPEEWFSFEWKPPLEHLLSSAMADILERVRYRSRPGARWNGSSWEIPEKDGP